MTIPQVPMGSIVGMFVSIILCVAAPVLMCIFLRRRCRADWMSLLVGAVTFLVAAMVLEQMLHSLVLMTLGEALTGNIWLYALYGAVAAAVFEEGGRWFAMKRILLKRNQLSRENSLMYGVGHGGIEAIFLTGFAYINNLITSFLVNSGGIEAILESLDEANRGATVQSLAVLGNTESLMFYLGGVERILAFGLQIALSVLMYRGVMLGKKQLLTAPFLIHFGVDFIAVVIAHYLPVLVAELVLLALVAAVCWWAYGLYHQEEKDV